MRLTVLNDVHIGVSRTAGTTPASQVALKNHILQRFSELLPETGDLMILGDLFDTGNVPMFEVLETYKVLLTWLNRSDGTLYNVAGNHDLNKSSNILSSFQFLGALLKMSHPERYVHVETPILTPYGYVIPHLHNQEAFNAALTAVPTCHRLFVHVNVDNNFAAQSDHSLNLSTEQIEALPVEQIVCAHEHHRRTLGKVVIPGNQIASSVADWLSPQDKFMAVINNGELALIQTSVRSEEFEELPWDSEPLASIKRFVRVTGVTTAEAAAGAISAINRLRASSPAFVVTNATSVQSADGNTVFSDSLESVQSFSILDALRRFLTDDEYSVVEKL